MKILENFNNEIKNYKRSNTTSNRANINKSKIIKNNNSIDKKDNNISKSISLSTMEKPAIYSNTQSNKADNINKEKSNSIRKKGLHLNLMILKQKDLKKIIVKQVKGIK